MDFNSEATITTAPKAVLDLILLEFWYNASEMFSFTLKNPHNDKQNIAAIRSRMIPLYSLIYRSIDKDKTQKINLEELYINCMSEEYEILYQTFLEITCFLYDKGILKFDSRIALHPTNIIERNKTLLTRS